MVFSKLVKYYFCYVLVSVTIISLLYNLDGYRPRANRNNVLISNLSLGLKYVLVWTQITVDPIKNLGEGQNSFINKKCSITNCYVSSDKRLLVDESNFDAIVFHVPELSSIRSLLPQSRSYHQKYIFASMESSENYPVCNNMYNNYFNLTWTYKLKSDVNYGYIAIRDKQGKVIGPKEEMHWKKVEDMMPINDTLKKKLTTKKYAVAWFVSNCAALSGRHLIAKKLQIELAKYNMTVDIFGKCGTKKCPRGSMKDCLLMLEKDYYFYLSFENSFSEDYVTEKLLHALQHYAVPVVYGGANYTRFMPDGIYLVARRQSISELAKDITDIINDKERYYSFFKWHNHYSYHDVIKSPETDAYCKLCAMLNNEQFLSTRSSYSDLITWWTPPNKCSEKSFFTV